MSVTAARANIPDKPSKPMLHFSADWATRSHTTHGGLRKIIWLPDRRWSSFTYPERSVKLRLIVRNPGDTARLIGGELRWNASSTDARPRSTRHRTIWRTRVAKTGIPPHAGVVIQLLLPVPKVGRYQLLWYRRHLHRSIATLTCIYRPTGIHTPVQQSRWVTPMPRFIPGVPGPFFARCVAHLVACSGIKRYWLTLTTGDPINARQRLFAAALRAAGDQLLLRVMYPLTTSARSRLHDTATTRWLHSALIKLAQPAFVEPIFIAGPEHADQKLQLMKKIFASDAAIVHAGSAHILLARAWYRALPAKLQASADMLVVGKTPGPANQSPPPNLYGRVLPIWALPGLMRHPQSDRFAARYLRAPASVVAVAPPWKNDDHGWLIHILGSGVWMQNQRLPHWGVASILQGNNRSVAVISRIPDVAHPGVKTVTDLWLPNRVVGHNVFKDMLLRRYDEGSYIQFMDPDAAISVFNVSGRRIIPLYPGLPRVPADDSEAVLVSTESAASLLAAVRTAVVRLEPRIISITTCRHVPAEAVGRQPIAPSGAVVGKHQRWIKLVIELRSQTPGTIQLAAVGGKNRYRLIEPARVDREQKGGRLVIYLRRPKHMIKMMVVLRGQRRTWLATIPISARLRDQ